MVIDKIIKKIIWVIFFTGICLIFVGCAEGSSAGAEISTVVKETTDDIGQQITQAAEFSTENLQAFSLYIGSYSGWFSTNGDITVYLNTTKLGTISDGKSACYRMYIDPGNYILSAIEEGKLKPAVAQIRIPDFSGGIFSPAVIAAYEKGKIDWIANDNPKYQSPYVPDDAIYNIVLPGTEDAVTKMLYGDENNGDTDNYEETYAYDDSTPVNSGQYIIEHDETAQDLLGEYTNENTGDDNNGIHQYEFVVADCSWYEAYEGAINSGGYLVNMNSDEEIEYIINELNNRGLNTVCFYIGGRRNELGEDTGYHWINAQGELLEERLDTDKYIQYWLPGEPSYVADGTNEYYMNLIFRKTENRWYWNDVPENIIDTSDYWSGKVGFIIEYE